MDYGLLDEVWSSAGGMKGIGEMHSSPSSQQQQQHQYGNYQQPQRQQQPEERQKISYALPNNREQEMYPDSRHAAGSAPASSIAGAQYDLFLMNLKHFYAGIQAALSDYKKQQNSAINDLRKDNAVLNKNVENMTYILYALIALSGLMAILLVVLCFRGASFGGSARVHQRK